MDRAHGSYELFKAIHEARMQSVRATAMAAGLDGRKRQRRLGLQRILRMFAPGRARRPATPDATSPETLFWA